MEPKSPTPRFESENPTVSYETKVETDSTQLTPEFAQSVERGGERIEQRSDSAIAQQAATPVLPPPLPLPIADEPIAAPAADASPLVAGDEDLIEKEWVDRAKHIIEQTKDDPYRREQEINKLQADYLRKRYGRELGAPQ
jgi:hypothetical protein